MPQIYRLMTYNIGGGRDDDGSILTAITAVITDVNPDILALQEVARRQDFTGTWHSMSDQIETALGGNFASFYDANVSMRQHFHTAKQAMVDALFHDDLDWEVGNALLSRWPFHRLGVREETGTPRCIPLFHPPRYLGNRDTDPRSAVLARIGRAPQYPLVIGTHLTTLVGERGKRQLEGKAAEAAHMRSQQTRHIMNLVGRHMHANQEIVFLLGDFNAAIMEDSLQKIIVDKGGFMHLSPGSAAPQTHPKVDTPIDHIFVYPAERVLEYKCSVIDTGLARTASDHLPVVATVVIE